MDDRYSFGMSTQERKEVAEARKKYLALNPEERFVFRLKNQDLEEDEEPEYVIMANYLSPLGRILDPEGDPDEVVQRLEHGMKDQSPENALKLAQEIILKTIELGHLSESLSAAKKIDLITVDIRNAAREKMISMIEQTPKEKWSELEGLYGQLEGEYGINVHYSPFRDELTANAIRERMDDKKYMKRDFNVFELLSYGVSDSFKENQPNLFKRIQNAERKYLRTEVIPELEKQRSRGDSHEVDRKAKELTVKLLNKGILNTEEDQDLIKKLRG